MSIYIDVPCAYLEMARAISNVLIEEMKNWEENPPDVDEEQMANVQFSLVSTIIIQCYMTIEAFINEELKNLWENSRNLDNETNKIKSSGIVEVQNTKSIYHEFYKKYGHHNNFKDLRKEKDLKNLGDRIKIICRTREIPQVHDSDKEIWDFFKKMEKIYRHYLIHIYPDNNKFYELVKEILLKNELDKYFETVQNIISHFYNQQDENPPEWLKKNTLYKFSGIDYL